MTAVNGAGFSGMQALEMCEVSLSQLRWIDGWMVVVLRHFNPLGYISAFLR